MPLDHERANAKAAQICAAFAPACDVISIAGSVRRGSTAVSDIEIVAVPKFFQQTMFLDPDWHAGSRLDACLESLVQRGALRWDTVIRRNGPHYKRLIVCSVETPLDVFLAAPDNYGNLLTIRTGPSGFSTLLVMRRSMDGLLPRGFVHRNGYLWRNDMRLACASELAFFAAIGLDVPAPATRTAELIPNLRRQQEAWLDQQGLER